ncbi:hypothetical protein MIDIC_510005 [Alphaproteobacteria bacterium]
MLVSISYKLYPICLVSNNNVIYEDNNEWRNRSLGKYYINVPKQQRKSVENIYVKRA